MNNFISEIDYLHINSIGNLDSCRQAAFSIRDYLTHCYDSKRIEGWGTYLISSDKKAEDVFILKNYIEITKGVYPFLYAYIQPFSILDLDVASFMDQQGFMELK
ncbi:MAG: hypothetical protein RIE73_06890 [Coleofasciculus sp. C1-SOL-03]|jgi:hypothetical protein|uniref:hypothetical protein n=1 Tax=Coleofasciculus sp. C1-SOL-03 TaxID=3069522 RepID=UPI0032FFD20A